MLIINIYSAHDCLRKKSLEMPSFSKTPNANKLIDTIICFEYIENAHEL